MFSPDSSIFTGMFSGHYSHPDGLCFDVLCTDDPIIDNLDLEGYNVDDRVG
jgi:lysosomal alpha-mannosidase